MSAELTVLLSTYNDAEFLEMAISSIEEQSFRDFILLIIDDYSNDYTTEVLRRHANSDSKIIFKQNSTNKGLGYNLYYGVQLANTKYIARMDADDISHPERLEKQINYLESNEEIDIVGTWAEVIDEQNQIIDKRAYPTDDASIKKIIWTNPMIHSSVMFRRESILRVGNYNKNLRKRQDYDLWFRAASAGLKFANIPEYLLKYRVTSNYYQQNNLKVALDHFRIGWKGCRLIKADLKAYIGVALPLVRSFFPQSVNRHLHKIQRKFDPRQKI